MSKGLALLLLLGATSARARPALQHGTLTVGGRERTYDWAGPEAGRHPLVIALHGRGGTGASEAKLSHLDEIAAREGFVVVFPDGVQRSWADARGTNAAARAGVDDVAFVRALIDKLVADGRVDGTRVYVTGMSNGAIMSWTLACKMADRVTAIAPVSGAMAVGDCKPSRPVPVRSFAGTDDPVLPFKGGGTPAGGDVLSADASAAFWAKTDGCTGAPVEEALPDKDPSDGTTVRARRWTACAGGATVELDTVVGGGHTWPGGKSFAAEALIGKTSRDLDASEEMWKFFAATKPLPGPAPASAPAAHQK